VADLGSLISLRIRLQNSEPPLASGFLVPLQRFDSGEIWAFGLFSEQMIPPYFDLQTLVVSQVHAVQAEVVTQ